MQDERNVFKAHFKNFSRPNPDTVMLFVPSRCPFLITGKRINLYSYLSQLRPDQGDIRPHVTNLSVFTEHLRTQSFPLCLRFTLAAKWI